MPSGKVAWITGGGSGIGLAGGIELAKAGAHVIISGRSRETLLSSEKQLKAAGSGEAIALDVSDQKEVAKSAQAILKRHGHIDILINSAGINIRGASDQLAEADWDTVIDVNLKGTFLCSRAVGPGMVRRGWGRVINMGSILSVIAMPGRAPYAAAKAGVLNLTRVFALEWAGTGVTANAICPGPFGTEMNRTLLDDPVKYQEFIKQIPMGRYGQPQELGPLAVYLASEASAYMTGAALVIDGGYTLW